MSEKRQQQRGARSIADEESFGVMRAPQPFEHIEAGTVQLVGALQSIEVELNNVRRRLERLEQLAGIPSEPSQEQ